jgi:hypothetical protein
MQSYLSNDTRTWSSLHSLNGASSGGIHIYKTCSCFPFVRIYIYIYIYVMSRPLRPRRIITAFIKTRYRTLFWAGEIQSIFLRCLFNVHFHGILYSTFISPSYFIQFRFSVQNSMWIPYLYQAFLIHTGTRAHQYSYVDVQNNRRYIRV